MNHRGRRLAAAFSAIVAIASLGGAFALTFWPTGQTDASTVTPDGPVLSPRRAPEVLHHLVADTRLASRVDLFARSLSSTSCVAIDADTAAVYRRNADQPLIPASSLKVATAAAFLAKVGGDGTFVTDVRGAEPDADGVVDGSITLIGGGDPLLATSGYVATRRHPPTPATDIATLASKLRAAGVRRITGGIGVVDSRYDAERRVPTWKPGYTTTGDVGPIGALAVDDGFVSYAPLAAASDPAIAAGEALRRALSAVGVTVDGPTARSSIKTTPVLARVESASYREVVAEMLRESDNNTAELLLRELAYVSGTRPATRAAGNAARVAALRGLGVAADAVEAIDGSGLDRSDRASCAALLATLTTKPGGYDLEDMLAVAGRSGTLEDRFTTSPLAGRLRAKTGSLENVTALVGLADHQAARKLRFAFISNAAFSDPGGKALQDRLVQLLATYPEAPAPAKLAP